MHLLTPPRELIRPRVEPCVFDGLSPREMTRLMRGVSGRAGYATLLNDPLEAALSFNTFTGPQDVTSTTTQPPLVIPANFLQQGYQIRTEAGGNFSTTGTPTLVFGVYWGTTVLAVNVAFTAANNAATLPWHLRTTTSIYKTGTAGVARTQGELWYGTNLTTTTQIPIPGIALADVAIDTTVATAWTVKATFSASSASNIVTLSQYAVELVNLTP